MCFKSKECEKKVMPMWHHLGKKIAWSQLKKTIHPLSRNLTPRLGPMHSLNTMKLFSKQSNWGNLAHPLLHCPLTSTLHLCFLLPPQLTPSPWCHFLLSWIRWQMSELVDTNIIMQWLLNNYVTQNFGWEHREVHGHIWKHTKSFGWLQPSM